jgi:hypothetical protein
VAFGGVLVVSGLVEATRRVVAWRKKRKKKRDAAHPVRPADPASGPG